MSGPARPELARAADDLAVARLGRGETVTVAVAGASMRPLLVPGDLVAVAPGLGAHPHRGQLLAARDAQGLLLHRLVAWDGTACVLKGDACGTADPPLPWSAVVGAVVGVAPGRSGPDDAGAMAFRPVDGRGWRAGHRLVGAASAWQGRLTRPGAGGWLCRHALATAIMAIGYTMRWILCRSRN